MFDHNIKLVHTTYHIRACSNSTIKPLYVVKSGIAQPQYRRTDKTLACKNVHVVLGSAQTARNDSNMSSSTGTEYARLQGIRTLVVPGENHPGFASPTKYETSIELREPRLSRTKMAAASECLFRRGLILWPRQANKE